MRDANIDLEAARYQPESVPNTLGSRFWLVLIVLFATLLMAGAYMQAVEYRAQQTAEIAR